ncbi:adenine-N(1)--methyltransferase [Talaromyces proteolyticus]|uniref:tRNA (adenine(58)-N(1))-methyltransferase catalytic subunit TRM61 n=1 Tax=Talaromyces proteolyticus TaxID=1131652 RepID=A0AAD4KRN8_9EURO|nr:adenine-N(1)--methyltransferase [Talaromyces proteolyticus]KAH8697744.1 adenine-N(1)--methyltransferase [Talaromyces proteolyticus]
MARFLQSLRHILGIGSSSPSTINPSSFGRSIDTDFTVFREGDRAIIHGRSPYLTKPLKRGDRTEVSRGLLFHDDIIGKAVWDPIKAHKGKEFRLSLPTLEDYVAFTPRLVTPIYGADASLIVSLLDIHVSHPTTADGDNTSSAQPLEILEAGTGHASLTLHLARAIQAANTNPPPIPAKSQVRILNNQPIHPYADEEEKELRKEKKDSLVEEAQKQWDEWRTRHRQAVIHTVDVSAKYSAHAEKIVRGFRRGIYAGNIDFHVGPVEEWIADQVQRRRKKRDDSAGLLSSFKSTRPADVEPFLSYAILDMPSAHQRIPHVAPVLRRGGNLVVFMPSITQIGDCVQLIGKERLPFVLEKVVELGVGLTSGRMWDVRMAVKKSRADPSSWGSKTEASREGAEMDHGEKEEESSEPVLPTDTRDERIDESNNVLICRPKVGLRIVGGGFIGIWRRVEDRSNSGDK